MSPNSYTTTIYKNSAKFIFTPSFSWCFQFYPSSSITHRYTCVNIAVLIIKYWTGHSRTGAGGQSFQLEVKMKSDKNVRQKLRQYCTCRRSTFILKLNFIATTSTGGCKKSVFCLGLSFIWMESTNLPDLHALLVTSHLLSLVWQHY